MDAFFNICKSESNMRFYLSRLKEYGEFDLHVLRYVEDCLNQRIIKKPSKGPYGEQGKDFVAIENEETKEYCSYVIKKGNLNSSLKGKYGVLKQMSDAMFMNLEEYEFHNIKRTVTIVYNGDDGNRGVSASFEKARRIIEEKAKRQGILLRSIERWDVGLFTKKIYPYCKDLLEKEEFRTKFMQLNESYDFVLAFREGYSKLNIDEQKPNSKTEEFVLQLNAEFIKKEENYGPFIKHT